MPRFIRYLVIVASLMCSLMLNGESDASKRVPAPHVWWAPDSSWAVMGFGRLRPGLAEEVMRKKPSDFEGAKVFLLEVTDPAVYLGFQVAFKRIEKVVFTKDTKLVLRNKQGKLIQSEAIFFCPDYLQTQLYDSRKMAIVVTKSTVFCHPENGCPCGYVKFPLGSIELKDIASFEVMGAMADSSEGAAREE